MKRIILSLGLAALMVAALTPAAVADEPVLITDSDTFTDVNPCTGEEHEVTIEFAFYDHEHENGAFVSPAVRSGTTDSGYVMQNGRDILVFTGNIVVAPFMDQWRHPDGSKFVVRGVFVGDFRDFQIRVDEFSARCIG